MAPQARPHLKLNRNWVFIDTGRTNVYHLAYAGICDDIIFEILDDETRNKYFSDGCYGIDFCDALSNNDQKGDWKGPNWYKIEDKAGTRIADTLVEKCHCNTDATGYIIGTHPTRVGETVERTVCFSWIDNPCWESNTIQSCW